MKIYKTTSYGRDGKQVKTPLSSIPVNTEYTVCLEEKNLISEVYSLCEIKNGSTRHKVLIDVDDTNNRFNHPSLHMAVYYVDAETNDKSFRFELNGEDFALLQEGQEITVQNVKRYMPDETLYDSKFYWGENEIVFDEDVTEKMSHDTSVNKDGGVDAFDLACLKRFLLNDAPETPDFAIENYRRVNNALGVVREYLEAEAPDWYARVTNIEMDAQTYDDGTLNTNLLIATVTFDQTLTEDAVYRLTEGVYDDVENYVTYAEENACKTVRITVNGGGDITSCVPVASGELNIEVADANNNRYVMMATEYLAENNASWYARMSSMDVSYAEETGNAVVTMVFDQTLNEDAIYTLTESERDNIEDVVAMFISNPSNVMRMVITSGGNIESCVPVYTEQQAVAVTEIAVEDTPECIIPLIAKTHMAETCPSWYAKMSSMDVEVTQDDAVITVAFDRPLDTIAVELMFVGELKSAYESALTLVEQNEISTMRMIVQNLEIVAFEPVAE